MTNITDSKEPSLLGFSCVQVLGIVRFGSVWILMNHCKTLFFRCILISRFPHVENSLHFNFADFSSNLFPISFGVSNKCYY